MADFDLDLAPDADLAPLERDPDTDDMFGAAEPPPTAAAPPTPAEPAPAYQVLARKYRPRTFEDLIGQEAMVRTLTNAFAADRIAHAFMLTGVRGVGKTTTARLLARALNYETDAVNRPSVELAVDGRHCRAIIEGRHLDVLELDAASRTKVDEMRELLESVRYAPVDARYKVYVIDEVHMLSTAAFNALLKTLEEPPPHAKFIFATTEIRKVPVTILSRCQRFDLRRVEPEVLVGHLRRVAAAEGASVDEDGLALIARAAEGSVRDSLSLLDQAIVQGEAGGPVSAETVRDMLGLADRAQTIALFEQVMAGKAAEALAAFRTLYGFGADPVQVASDLLEHAHAASVAKTLGPGALALPKDQTARLADIGARASAGSLSRVWQMLLKAHEEARRAPDPAAAVEMALIRLCYAADLPGPEEALRRLQSGEAATPAGAALPPPSPGGGQARASGGGQAPARQPAPQPAPASNLRPVQAPTAEQALHSFEQIVGLVQERRDMVLNLDLQRYVRPLEVRPGVVSFSLAENAPANLAQRLSARLKEWTGRPWMMDIRSDVEGPETGWERDRREEADDRASIDAHPFVVSLMAAFPGAEIVGVRKVEIAPLTLVDPGATDPNEDED